MSTFNEANVIGNNDNEYQTYWELKLAITQSNDMNWSIEYVV